MLTALTRPVSASLAKCELTHLARIPLDVQRARRQHALYESALEQLGVRVVRVAGDDALPDAVFIEDAAVVVDELAVIARPGAESRRAETPAVALALASWRRLAFIEPPGTFDGGDVLRVGKKLWVGLSSRTNEAGAAQLRQALAPFGYSVEGVRVTGCLHLKSAVTAVRENLLLVNPAWVPANAFADIEQLAIDPAEPYAANALRLADGLIFPAHFPLTRARLESRGIHITAVPCDELAKAEGAVTCCSILLETLG